MRGVRAGIGLMLVVVGGAAIAHTRSLPGVDRVSPTEAGPVSPSGVGRVWVFPLDVGRVFRPAGQETDLNDVSRVPRVTIDELKKLMASGRVVIIDVRSAEAYRDSHLAGAISMPLDTITERAKDLKSFTKPLVTYCS